MLKRFCYMLIQLFLKHNFGKYLTHTKKKHNVFIQEFYTMCSLLRWFPCSSSTIYGQKSLRCRQAVVSLWFPERLVGLTRLDEKIPLLFCGMTSQCVGSINNTFPLIQALGGAGPEGGGRGGSLALPGPSSPRPCRRPPPQAPQAAAVGPHLAGPRAAPDHQHDAPVTQA